MGVVSCVIVAGYVLCMPKWLGSAEYSFLHSPSLSHNHNYRDIMRKLSPNTSIEICVFKVLYQNCMHMPHLDVLFYPNYWMPHTLPAFCEIQNKNRIFKCFRFKTSGSVIWSLWTGGSIGTFHTSGGLGSCLKLVTYKREWYQCLIGFIVKLCLLKIAILFLRNSSV